MSEPNLDNVPDEAEYDANDAGRASRFIDDNHLMVRYVPKWKVWLIWGKHRWEVDEDGAITRLAIAHAKTLVGQAQELGDHKTWAAAVKSALLAGNAQAINNMLALAK